MTPITVAYKNKIDLDGNPNSGPITCIVPQPGDCSCIYYDNFLIVIIIKSINMIKLTNNKISERR